MQLHITITKDNSQSHYTTEAIDESGRICDALYGVINDHGRDIAAAIEYEVNEWAARGYREGSVHGKTFNAEWEIK